MNLTAVFPTILLFVGCSLGTKDKTVAVTPDGDLILPNVSLTKEDTVSSSSLPSSSPKPGYKQAASPKPARFKLLKPYLDPVSYEYSIACMPAIRKEEDEPDSVKEDYGIFACNPEQEAEYPGGIVAWRSFLNKNLKYPTDTSGNAIQGTVVVQFVVDEEGNVTDVKAVKGLESLSTEAVRVIKKSSKWTPGRLYSNGRHIKSYKVQPVIFRAE